MAEFWLSDGTTTLDLGDNVKEISLEGGKRNFDIVDFALSNGGYIRGVGSYSARKFSVTRDDFIQANENIAWNQRRTDFMKWFTKPVYASLYLNMQYSTDAITLRTRVYPTKLGKDTFKNSWNYNDGRDFELVSPTGIWEETTAIAANVSITSTNEQTVTISNTGMLESAPIFSFTPDSASATIFQVKISEGYGFRLEGSFSTVIISYYMSNGKLTVDGAEVDATNYLSAGSPFLFPITSTAFYVTASSGVFNYSFNKRYI